MIRLVDGFAGAGGFHLGTASVGRVVLAIEKNKQAQATYRTNFPDTPLVGDICEVEALPEHDLFCGGFPCQPFSFASNSREGYTRQGLRDPRGTLFYEIVRLLKASQPAAFLLENVPAIIQHDGGATLATIMGELEGAGYAVDWRIINAAPWVPQKRKRVFFMGLRSEPGDLDTMFRLKSLVIETPPPPHPVLADILHEFVDPEHAPGPMSKRLHAQLVQRDADNAKAGRGFRTNLVGSKESANTVIARYASANRCSENIVLMDDPSYDIDASVETKMRAARLNCGRRDSILLNPKQPSRTITAKPPGQPGLSALLIGDGRRIRRLTPREVARAQGFPEWFVLPASDGNAYRQMGNAVVPQVVEAVVQAMLPLIKNIL